MTLGSLAQVVVDTWVIGGTGVGPASMRSAARDVAAVSPTSTFGFPECNGADAVETVFCLFGAASEGPPLPIAHPGHAT